MSKRPGFINSNPNSPCSARNCESTGLACSASLHSVERMAILQLRAMRGWNKTETARHFFVSDDAVRAWLQRAEDDSLVQTNSPVNRFPDFIRYAVQQIKLFCPTLGKVKIADMLARAGILGKTTVGRILRSRSTSEARLRCYKLCRLSNILDTPGCRLPRSSAASGPTGCPTQSGNDGPFAGGC